MRFVSVVTHPEASHHVAGLVGGWYNSELTERGHHRAAQIARHLRLLVPRDAHVGLYSSDLLRTRQTADAVAEMFGVRPVLDADLREKSYGVAGGRPQAWLDERFVFPPAVGERLDHDEGIEGGELGHRGLAENPLGGLLLHGVSCRVGKCDETRRDDRFHNRSLVALGETRLPS